MYGKITNGNIQVKWYNKQIKNIMKETNSLKKGTMTISLMQKMKMVKKEDYLIIEAIIHYKLQKIFWQKRKYLNIIKTKYFNLLFKIHNKSI